MDYKDEESDFFRLAEEATAEREEKEKKKEEKKIKRENRKNARLEAKEAKKSCRKGDSETYNEIDNPVTNEDLKTDIKSEIEKDGEIVNKKSDMADNEIKVADNSEDVEVKISDNTDDIVGAADTGNNVDINGCNDINDANDSADKNDISNDDDDDTEKTNKSRHKKIKEKNQQDKKGKYRNPKFNIVNELISVLIYMGIVIIICFLMIKFVGRRVVVNGNSMNDTLQNGNSLWVDMLSYKFEAPKRYDIIIFPYEGTDTIYVKRIIGLPGEKVQILADGTILINDKPLNEHYGNTSFINDPGIAAQPFYLSSDEYFVLGDNRNNSHDSRYSDVGNIKKDEIIGKVVLRITPLNEFGKVNKK